MGRRPLKPTPDLCTEMASAINLASDGREESQVPPEDPQTTQIYYGQRGESRLVLEPTAPSHFKAEVQFVQTYRAVCIFLAESVLHFIHV